MPNMQALISQDVPSWSTGNHVFPLVPVENNDSFLDNALSQTTGLARRRLTIASHKRFRHVRELLAAIERRQRLARSAERTRLEMQWLSEHRVEYAGQWVALIGEILLAAGRSAREVCEAVRNAPELPLIARVEPPNQFPFAGW